VKLTRELRAQSENRKRSGTSDAYLLLDQIKLFKKNKKLIQLVSERVDLLSYFNLANLNY